jgi:hypothetical protein
MSVHGEFERYLEATSRALRETGRAEDRDRADEIDAVTEMRDEPLEARARRVIEGPLGHPLPHWQAFPRVAESADRLLSISRIILGR